MNIQVTSFTYNFTDGQIDSAQVGLYAQAASTGEYVNASIRVAKSDLAENTSFLNVAMSDIIAIAKKKLATETMVKDATTAQA
ncbi:hypothetical protein HCZ19_00940 [Limosilactobacillus fermentum]